MEWDGLQSLDLTLEAASAYVYAVNLVNGWYDEQRTFGEDVALLHSEVSEMLEEWRDYGAASLLQYNVLGGNVRIAKHEAISKEILEELKGQVPKPIGIGSEAADVLIRLLDTCRRYDINLAQEFRNKMRYNETRERRHGGKRL